MHICNCGKNRYANILSLIIRFVLPLKGGALGLGFFAPVLPGIMVTRLSPDKNQLVAFLRTAISPFKNKWGFIRSPDGCATTQNRQTIFDKIGEIFLKF